MWKLRLCMTTCTSLYLLLYSFFSVKMTRKLAVWFPKHNWWTPLREQIPAASFFFFPPFLRKNWTIFDHLQRANSTNLQLKTFFPPKIFHWEQLFFAITLSSLILTLSNKNTNILLHGKIISPKVKQKLLVIICKSKLWLHIP